MDPGRAPEGPGRVSHLGQAPQRRHRQIDIGSDGALEIGARNVQPRQDRSLDSAVPQCDRLTEVGDPQPRGTTSQGGPGTGHEPVSVAVGLDDRHHFG